MNKDGLEIERRFLLAKMPNLSRQKEVKKYYILQTYIQTENHNQVYRLRWELEKKAGQESKVLCYRTTKEEVSHGITKECEVVISINEYFEEIRGAKKNNKIIGNVSKNRTKVKTEQGFWEIDEFEELSLIIAEIELDKLDDLKKLPYFIEKNKIMEITGIREFSNYSLSKKHNKKYYD